MKRLFTILVLLLTPTVCMGQLIVTPVNGVATIDIASCGQGATGPNPSCTFKLTLTANTTLAFNNVFSGASANLFINPSTFTLTWPASVPTPPTLAASTNNAISLRFDGTTGTWIVSGGSGGITSGLSNITLATTCSGANCFVVSANETQITDGVTSGTTVTSASGGFANAVTGMGIEGFTSSGTGGCSAWGGVAPQVTQQIGSVSTQVTIASVQSSTQITLSQAANANVSNVCVDYGNSDDAGASLADAALASAKVVPKIILPAGRLRFAQAHFIATLPRCTNSIQQLSGTPYGVAACLVISGQGPGATTIHYLPTFNFTTATGGPLGHSTMGGQTYTQIRDLTITGDGVPWNGGTVPAAGVNGVELNCGSLVNVALLALGYNSPATNPFIGVQSTCPSAQSFDVLSNVVEDGFGGIGVNIGSNDQMVGCNVALADNPRNVLFINGSVFLNCGTNLVGQNTAGNANQALIEVNGVGTVPSDIRLASFYTASPSIHGIQLDVAATVTLAAVFSPLASASTTDIVLNNAGAVLKIAPPSNFILGGAGSAICGGSGGTVIDLSPTFGQGNTYGGTCSFTTYTFKHTEVGTCVFAAATTCTVTFAQPFGSSATPAGLQLAPINPGAVTFTVTALSATGATITASASNSLSVGWQAKL